MAATGYVTGDPAKVDVSSVGEIGGPAGPLDGSGLIPSAQIPGGGGGGPSPAGTVTAETSYGGSSAAGSASTYSRGDHTHGTPALSSSAASASAVGDTAAAGSGTTAAKSDHSHGRESFGAATAQTSYGGSSTNGTATTPARSDHLHGTPALTGSAPGNSAVGDTAAVGTATAPARADHTHGREAFGAVTAQTSFGASSGNGSASTVAHSDHTHGTPAAPGRTWAFSLPGTLTTTTGKARIYNDTGATMTLRSVRATVGTAPTGATLIIDLNKNGTTMFTTQGNRPTVAISGNTSGKVTNADVTSIADGDYLTVDVDQVGSTVAGADLVVQVEVG
jgi:hypothetical protein